MLALKLFDEYVLRSIIFILISVYDCTFYLYKTWPLDKDGDPQIRQRVESEVKGNDHFNIFSMKAKMLLMDVLLQPVGWKWYWMCSTLSNITVACTYIPHTYTGYMQEANTYKQYAPMRMKEVYDLFHINHKLDISHSLTLTVPTGWTAWLVDSNCINAAVEKKGNKLKSS